MEENHLFKYISRTDLKEMLEAFHAVVNLNVIVITEDGKELLSCGKQYDFCRSFVRLSKPDKSCAQEHARAGRMAREFGESYIFSCHSGLNHIVYPTMVKGRQFGSVLAGPFLMENPEEFLGEEWNAGERLPSGQQKEFLQRMKDIPGFTPTEVTQISALFRYLVRSVLVESREIIAANKEKLLQQSRINEAIQLYKNSGVRDEKTYPIELENELIIAVKANNRDKTREILNKLLGIILLYEGHEITRVKFRIMELCSLLSRASISRGADPGMLLELNWKLVSSVVNARSIYDVCYRIQDNIEIFTDNLFQSPEHNSRIVKSVMEYVAKNFTEEITLASIAEQFHVNASYMSMLFRQVTGMTFKEYLNRVRIEEAERLLSNTDYPIIEIAIACGYHDQSYFTKVFKKYTGLTPRKYR